MKEVFRLVRPQTVPVLDPDFRPPVLANRAFLAEVDASISTAFALRPEKAKR